MMEIHTCLKSTSCGFYNADLKCHVKNESKGRNIWTPLHRKNIFKWVCSQQTGLLIDNSAVWGWKVDQKQIEIEIQNFQLRTNYSWKIDKKATAENETDQSYIGVVCKKNCKQGYFTRAHSLEIFLTNFTTSSAKIRKYRMFQVSCDCEPQLVFKKFT